jgi:hypothetical protein
MTQPIVVRVDEDGADPERREQLGLQLREELLAAGTGEVSRLAGGAPPAGTRAVDPAIVGALVVAATSSAASLAQVVDVVRRWRTRGPSGRAVEVAVGEHRLALTGASADEEAALVAAFLAAAGPGPHPT